MIAFLVSETTQLEPATSNIMTIIKADYIFLVLSNIKLFPSWFHSVILLPGMVKLRICNRRLLDTGKPFKDWFVRFPATHWRFQEFNIRYCKGFLKAVTSSPCLPRRMLIFHRNPSILQALCVGFGPALEIKTRALRNSLDR